MKKILHFFLFVLSSNLVELFACDKLQYQFPAVYDYPNSKSPNLLNKKSGYQRMAIISINKKFDVPRIVDEIIVDLQQINPIGHAEAELDHFNNMAEEIRALLLENDPSFQLATDRFI